MGTRMIINYKFSFHRKTKTYTSQGNLQGIRKKKWSQKQILLIFTSRSWRNTASKSGWCLPSAREKLQTWIVQQVSLFHRAAEPFSASSAETVPSSSTLALRDDRRRSTKSGDAWLFSVRHAPVSWWRNRSADGWLRLVPQPVQTKERITVKRTNIQNWMRKKKKTRKCLQQYLWSWSYRII